MANYRFPLACTNVGGTRVEIAIYVCDTYAGRPVTSLNIGDIGVMLDQTRIYFANSATTWIASVSGSSGYFTGDVTVNGGLYLATPGGGSYSYLISAAAGPEILTVPSDPGGTVITNYAPQTLYSKTLDGPAIVFPTIFTGSSTGTVRIGELAAAPSYAGIGLAGSMVNYNLLSSPGDTNLYINRPSGKTIEFREAGAAGQMTLLAGGALVGKMDTMTYAATISLDVTLGNTHKTTLTGNATINASAAGSGDQHMTVILVNDATLARTTTFGTNFRSAGVVVGTISKVAVVKFVSDGAAWFEESRTLVL